MSDRAVAEFERDRRALGNRALCCRGLLVAASGPILCAVALGVRAEAPIPKALLIGMALEQSAVLCASDAFTACMGFDEERCFSLARETVETCFGPLPDEIDPAALDPATLEACPLEVYANAGFDEDRAAKCVDEVGDQGAG